MDSIVRVLYYPWSTPRLGAHTQSLSYQLTCSGAAPELFSELVHLTYNHLPRRLLPSYYTDYTAVTALSLSLSIYVIGASVNEPHLVGVAVL